MGDTNVVIPGMFVVVDDSSAETPCWVDAGAGDGNGGHMSHKHSETNGQWCQYLHNFQKFSLN